MNFEGTVTIEKPVEEVFAFVLDPSNSARWQTGVVEERQTSDGPMGVGAEGIRVEKVIGKRLESN